MCERGGKEGNGGSGMFMCEMFNRTCIPQSIPHGASHLVLLDFIFLFFLHSFDTVKLSSSPSSQHSRQHETPQVLQMFKCPARRNPISSNA